MRADEEEGLLLDARREERPVRSARRKQSGQRGRALGLVGVRRGVCTPVVLMSSVGERRERLGGCGEVVRANGLGPSRRGEKSPQPEQLLRGGGAHPPLNCGVPRHGRQQRGQLRNGTQGCRRPKKSEEGNSSAFFT